MFALRTGRAVRAVSGRATCRMSIPLAARPYSSTDTTTSNESTSNGAASEGASGNGDSTATSNGNGNGNGSRKHPSRNSPQSSVTDGRPVRGPSPKAVRQSPPKPAAAAKNGTVVVKPDPSSASRYEAKTIATSQPSMRATLRDVDVDWENSYHGVATRPVTEAQFNVLMRPLDEKDIEVKPDGIIYLPEIKYRRRLNEAFGPMGWGLIPRGEPIISNGIVTREYSLIIDGRFVSQAQGENQYFSPEGMPSAVEGCKSNALMRCCKDLGIGSELWDPNFIRAFKKRAMQEVWVEHTTTKKKRTFWFKKDQVQVSYPWKKV